MALLWPNGNIAHHDNGFRIKAVAPCALSGLFIWMEYIYVISILNLTHLLTIRQTLSIHLLWVQSADGPVYDK